MGLTIFYIILSYVLTSSANVGNVIGIFGGILSVPQNIVMDLKNVVKAIDVYLFENKTSNTKCTVECILNKLIITHTT